MTGTRVPRYHNHPTSTCGRATDRWERLQPRDRSVSPLSNERDDRLV
jgi:hypothetical protein